MLRITKETDYAIVLLTRFAGAGEGAVLAARDLASATHLPQPMVGKILKSLSRGGLLASIRGVHGGYRLARRPEEVSVAEVIAAIEGPIALTQCLGHDAHVPGLDACALEPSCPTRPHWSRINLAIRDALERLPLADLMRPRGSGFVPLGAVGRPGGAT
jgi:FeS assembly SUF system regulator